MEIEGGVAVVTGASSGIGEIVARDLAEKGARVAMVARTRSALERARRGFGALSKRCSVHACDVGDWDAVHSTVKRISRSVGRPSILINNAGISAVTSFAQMDPAEMDRMVRTNLLGVLHCTRAVLLPMRATRRGVIVNVGSISGLFAVPHMSVYAATKWALTGFSESLNAELANEGIHVGVVCPAVVNTPLVERTTARSGIAVPELITLKRETVSKAIQEIITRERDIIVLPRALTPIAAIRPTVGPLIRWATRGSAPLFKPKPGAKTSGRKAR
jgi:short-subunit dehydrogenase